MFTKALINGEFISGGDEYSIINPASMQELARCSKLGTEAAQNVVDAAAVAFRTFKNTLAKERSQLLLALADLVAKNRDELARIMTLENGKVLSEAQGEIDYSIAFFRWFAEEAKRIKGHTQQSVRAGQRIFSIKQPIGVVAAITPWNFPLAMLARKISPAIAAGCTMVIKPSEETPLTAYYIGKLCMEAGFPKGVVNIISGNASEIGDVFCAAHEVKLLTFTGSTGVGKMLMAKCAGTVKKVALELGGNAPFIVFDDADVEKAAAGLLSSKLRNGGQSCICANRIYVQKSVFAEFTQSLKSQFSKIVVADGLESGAQLGPMINQAAIDKVESLIADSLHKDGKLYYQMDITKQKSASNFFCAPTILLNNSKDTLIESTEIFAPVVSIFQFESEEEALHRANATNYGLASYFYSEDMRRIFRVSDALEYGMVGVNDVIISNETINFGGVKESGLGREGGDEGILEYLETKQITLS